MGTPRTAGRSDNAGEENPHLEVKNLTKTFRIDKDRSMFAVDDVSFSVARGEFVTIIGPSGCGKTTTLRLIAGFLEPTAGEIICDGRSITRLDPEERNIPMVFQNYALFPHKTVYDNIAYGLRARKKPPDAITHDVAMICQMLNLVGTENRHPAELSDGQQQRVALARALVLKPPIILFDEPLSNLDARLRIQTRAEIQRMQQILGITVLYVTHDQGEALSLPDRVVVMNKGRIAQVGKPAEVYNRPASPFVADFIGNANFFDARILSAEGGFVRIDFNSMEIQVPLGNCDYRPTKDEQVLVAVNPAAVRLERVDGILRSGQILGMIEQSSFNGPAVEYRISFGSTYIRVVQPNNPTDPCMFEEGSAVVLTFDPRTFRVYGAGAA